MNSTNCFQYQVWKVLELFHFAKWQNPCLVDVNTNFVWYTPTQVDIHPTENIMALRNRYSFNCCRKSLHIWVLFSQDGVPWRHVSPFLYKSPRLGIPGSAPAGEKEKRLKAAGGLLQGPWSRGSLRSGWEAPKTTPSVLHCHHCGCSSLQNRSSAQLVTGSVSWLVSGARSSPSSTMGLAPLATKWDPDYLIWDFFANLYSCVRCIFTFSCTCSSAFYTGHSVNHWVGRVSN